MYEEVSKVSKCSCKEGVYISEVLSSYITQQLPQVKGKKCKRIWIPPENELNHEIKVYVIFAFAAFLTCYCTPALVNKLIVPYLLGEELMEIVEYDGKIKV